VGREGEREGGREGAVINRCRSSLVGCGMSLRFLLSLHSFVEVHPTLPYVLSASDDMTIKLFDWDKNCH